MSSRSPSCCLCLHLCKVALPCQPDVTVKCKMKLKWKLMMRCEQLRRFKRGEKIYFWPDGLRIFSCFTGIVLVKKRLEIFMKLSTFSIWPSDQLSQSVRFKGMSSSSSDGEEIEENIRIRISFICQIFPRVQGIWLQLKLHSLSTIVNWK